MGDKTAIAWTNHTFNPWWGCTKIDPGCAHCYAETFAHNRIGLDIWGPNKPRRELSDKHWSEPMRWNEAAKRDGKTHRVFCGSMCDWAEDHPKANSLRPRLWSLIWATPYLTWQLLTKRADRIANCLPMGWNSGYRNVWLGVSISEAKGLWRRDELVQVPAVVRFISYEPALGDISATLDLHGIDWVIFGGESGPGHRAPDGWQDWARLMRDRCAASGVAFFFKQSPAPRTEMGTTLDGVTLREFPQP
ncbi:MAG: hypothetical protein DMF06_00930 [Verrucomicrobia bacterium]|nr:MAG: hypothetical protein DMF06_00930 [Verrucomicrobiota bacterium]HTD88794.1 DUF5131 family protein [Candidatus Binatia bacterium]